MTKPASASARAAASMRQETDMPTTSTTTRRFAAMPPRPAAILCAAFVAALMTAPVRAGSVEDAQAAMRKGNVTQAISELQRATTDHPAHEAAWALLADAYEASGDTDKAVETWRTLMVLSSDDATLREARRAIARLRRRELDQRERTGQSTSELDDPFKIDMPDVNWNGLEVIEDNKYLPPILPPPSAYDVPPFVHESEHFTVYSTNERLSQVIAQRAEIYLEFMQDKLFSGKSWPLRIPILVYTTRTDYEQHGGPRGSGGVTMSHVTGKTQVILLYQLADRVRTGRSSGGGIWKYGIESVLPHELTHAVVNEFFAGQRAPRWLHEAIAGRFEQTRDHYGEAARLARKVVAGEFFRMRDLFEQKNYPERIELFYEQSAAVVLYMFEAGPEAMHTFLAELKATGNDHDAAISAALGIEREGAVEEFERRWVLWMKRRYERDLARAGEEPVDLVRATISIPFANEQDTIRRIENWRSIDVSRMSNFCGVGESLNWWTADGTVLRCRPDHPGLPTMLGIRLNYRRPVAIRAKVRFRGNPGDPGRWFGFAQLDADNNDTEVRVIAPLHAHVDHEIVCIWSDELAVYLDGRCAGRYPAFEPGENQRDIDFPLALIAYGPTDVQSLEVAPIDQFSTVQMDPPDDPREATVPLNRRKKGWRWDTR